MGRHTVLEGAWPIGRVSHLPGVVDYPARSDGGSSS